MRTSIAMKVVSVYLVIVISSLGLAGFLTNRAIEHYVIQTTKASLIADGRKVIQQYEHYNQLVGTAKDKSPDYASSALMVGNQSVQREYVIVDVNGIFLWNTFSAQDLPLLTQVSDMVAKALRGNIASGTYPEANPLFEFVAIPFTYVARSSFQSRFNTPLRLLLPDQQGPYPDNTKAVVLFARISDLQRITSEIWLAVAQGLLIASGITGLVGVVLARRLMKPAGIIRKAIERVRERDFTAVPVVRTGDEWEDFATAFGDMVRSLQAFDEGQKRFLQNASHELNFRRSKVIGSP